MDGEAAKLSQDRIEAALDRLAAAVAEVHLDLRSHMAMAAAKVAPSVECSPTGSAMVGSGREAPVNGPASGAASDDARGPPSVLTRRRSFQEIMALAGASGGHSVASDDGVPGRFRIRQDMGRAGSYTSFNASDEGLPGRPQLGGLHEDMLRAGSYGSDEIGGLHRAGFVSKRLSLGLPPDWPCCLRKHAFGDQYDLDEIERMPAMVATTSEDSEETKLLFIPEAQLHGKFWDADKYSFVQGILAFMGLLVLSHDVTITPFALAWQLEFEGYLAVSAYCSVAFWSFDVACTFALGSIFRPKSMPNSVSPSQYLRTWFCLDMFLIAADLCYITVQSISKEQPREGVRLLQFAKAARLVRIVGLLRAVHIVHRLREAFERSFTEYVKAAISVGSVLCGILWCTHALACTWFAVGEYADADTGGHWTDLTVRNWGEAVEYRNMGRRYQYVTALHWALQQLVLAGSIDTGPCNTAERVCNMACLMLGFMCGSLLVSSLSATMVDLTARQSEKDAKMRSLRKYLRQSAVHNELGERVLRQVADRLSAPAASGEEIVPGMEMLSHRLRTELHAHVCAPSIVTHPLFRLWAGMDAAWFSRLCSEVVKIMFLRASDDLFSAGTNATAAFVVVFGTVVYTESDGRPNSPVQETEVTAGMWLCECALWSEWVHVGTATARTMCRVLTLNPSSFQEVCKSHRMIGALAHAYCKQYYRRLINSRPPVSKGPSDLLVPSTDFADIVSSMPKVFRSLVGSHALRHNNLSLAYEGVALLARGRKKAAQSQEKLKENLLKEVMEGKSTVVVDGTGKLARIVSLIVLRVEDSTGKMLVQLGKEEDGTVVANCELPGAKYLEEELVDGALKRILTTKLAPFMDLIELSHIEIKSTQKFSAAYGLHTKYLHTVCHAIMTGDFDGPVCSYTPPDNNFIARSLTASRTATMEDMDTSEPKQFNSQLPSSVIGGPVYFIEYQGKGAYFAWLTPADLDQLQKPPMKTALLDFLSRLEPPGVTENARAIDGEVVMGFVPTEGDGEQKKDDMGSLTTGDAEPLDDGRNRNSHVGSISVGTWEPGGELEHQHVGVLVTEASGCRSDVEHVDGHGDIVHVPLEPGLRTAAWTSSFV